MRHTRPHTWLIFVVFLLAAGAVLYTGALRPRIDTPVGTNEPATTDSTFSGARSAVGLPPGSSETISQETAGVVSGDAVERVEGPRKPVLEMSAAELQHFMAAERKILKRDLQKLFADPALDDGVAGPAAKR